MPIEQIIKRIDVKDYKGSGAGQFLYDAAQQAIVDRVPLLGGRHIRAYQVATSAAGIARAQGSLGAVPVRDPETGTWVKFHIDYQAWVTPNNAADLVRACGDGDPGARLASLLIETAQQVVGRDPSVLDDHGTESVVAVEREIEHSVLRRCGLTAIVRLRLDGDEFIETPTIHADVEARPVDYPLPVKLTVTVLTEVRTRERARANDALRRKPPPNFSWLAERACQDAVKKMLVAQLRFDLAGEVARQVRIGLEPMLAAFFIRTRELRLSFREKLVSPLGSFECSLRVDLAVRGYPTTVPLSIPLHLQLRDEAAYWRAGRPELASWVESEGRQVVTRSLHGARYSQLCLQASHWEDRVLQALHVAAGAIGYTISAQVDLPRAPEGRFLTPFALEVDGEFASADSNSRAQLSIALQLRLETLDSVAAYLDAGVDLEAAFRAAVREEVAAHLHTQQPGRLFTDFDDPLPVTVPLGTERNGRAVVTVESILRDRVEQGLRRRFGLRVLSFTAKLGASEILALRAALLGAPAIEFKVHAQLEHVAAVVHHGTLQVDDIRREDWAQFQRRRPSVDDVRRAAERAMQSLLHDAMAAYGFGLPSVRIREFAYRDMPVKVREALGVTVHCVSWERGHSEDDDEIAEVKRELRKRTYAAYLKDHDDWQKDLDQLKARRRTLLLRGEHEKAQQVEQQIVDLRQNNPAAPGRRDQAALPWGADPHTDREADDR